jgi:hypothetical protein
MDTKSFNQSIHEIADEIADLVISKQKDYGPKNILNSPFGAEHGIIVRLYDKVARIVNLINKEQDALNESLEDSFKDIVGYALIALMVRRETFTNKLEQ